MGNRISSTVIIHPHVEIGQNVIIEDYCIIGVPFGGYNGEKTIIGDNSIIRSHTVIYAGNIIGNNFQTGNKANIRELNSIGDNVSIGTLSVIEHHVQIDNNVRIHSQVFIPEYSILKEGCWIGPNVVFTNALYPNSKNAKETLQGATVEENAIVGANCTILPGIRIKQKSLIGAGSVVTKDVSTRSVVVGNPARPINSIDELPY